MIVYNKNINMRTVTTEDAEFIYNMRQIQDKTKYLSKVTGTVESQKEWIENYKQREKNKKEFYFVIKSKDGEKLGLIRMYDFLDNSFCWGSWSIREDAPKSTTIESALQIYELGLYKLKFERSRFDVLKENDKVIAFHQKIGVKILDEVELNYFFNFEKNDYEVTKEKKRYL